MQGNKSYDLIAFFFRILHVTLKWCFKNPPCDIKMMFLMFTSLWKQKQLFINLKSKLCFWSVKHYTTNYLKWSSSFCASLASAVITMMWLRLKPVFYFNRPRYVIRVVIKFVTRFIVAWPHWWSLIWKPQSIPYLHFVKFHTTEWGIVHKGTKIQNFSNQILCSKFATDYSLVFSKWRSNLSSHCRAN